MDFETWRTYLEKYGPPQLVIDELETMIYEVEEWPTVQWKDWQKQCVHIASRLHHYAAQFFEYSTGNDET